MGRLQKAGLAIVLCTGVVSCKQVPPSRPDPYTNTFVDNDYSYRPPAMQYRDNDMGYAPPAVIYRDNEIYQRVPRAPAAAPAQQPPAAYYPPAAQQPQRQAPMQRQPQQPVNTPRSSLPAERGYYQDNDASYQPPGNGQDLLFLMDDAM